MKPHPMDVERHLECGRRLTRVLCGWTCKPCNAVWVDVECGDIEARWLVQEGKR